MSESPRSASGAAQAAGTAVAGPSQAAQQAGPFALPPLPYEQNALEPHISAETLSYHYGKHHRAYVDTLNKLVAGTPDAGRSLDDIVRSAPAGALFNAAGQAWNHEFYWKSLKPKSGGEPSGELARAVERDFGSLAKFREEFAKAAVSLFGSGWAWLVLDQGRLKVAQTSNADNPLRHGELPLLVLDVWEHAYYIDYRNARAKYVEAALAHLLNWEFAASNFAKAGGR